MPAQTVLKVRRDTAANWTSTNPTLANGEPGFETDTKKLKIGDGTTAWASLAYYRDVPIGGPQLIYRYTVAGAAKASIDTGVDTADAGSNDWTDGDILKVYITARTDEAGANPSVDIILNNDAGANYDVEHVFGNSSTATGGGLAAQSAIAVHVHGDGGTANYPGVVELEIPDYNGTTFYKTIKGFEGQVDATAGNRWAIYRCWGWRNTAAITRLKVAGQATAKLKIGSQLLIYKYKAS